MKRQNAIASNVMVGAVILSFLLPAGLLGMSFLSNETIAAPAEGDWNIDSAVALQNETVVIQGNTILKPDSHLSIINSHVTFSRNVSLQGNSTLLIHNSTVIFVESIYSIYGSVLTCDESTLFVFEDFLIQGDVLRVENTDVRFKGSSSEDNGYFLSAALKTDILNTTFESDSDSNFMVGFFEPAEVTMYNCSLLDSGVQYRETETYVSLYSASSSLVVDTCNIYPKSGMGIFFEEGNGTIKDSNIIFPHDSNNSYGITSFQSVLEVENTLISGQNNSISSYGIGAFFTMLEAYKVDIRGFERGIVLSNAPNSHTGDPLGTLKDSNLSGNIHGIFLDSSQCTIKDNSLGGNEVGLTAINSVFMPGLHLVNNFSFPEKNGEDAIRYERELELRLLGVRGLLLSQALVSIEETGWSDYTGQGGTIWLKGGQPLEAYVMDRDGDERYSTYTINAAYNTGVYTSTTTFFLDALNATFHQNLIELHMDAGPDLVLSSMRLSTSVAPSGSFVDVTLNITNHWWYAAEDVLVRVENDASFNEAIIPSIPANGTAQITISLSVGERNKDTIVEIIGTVDPSREDKLEGQHIYRDNNVLREEIEVRTAMADSSVPTTGLLVAIAILLPIFLFSMYRTLSTNKEEEVDGEDGREQKSEEKEPFREERPEEPETRIEENALEQEEGH